MQNKMQGIRMSPEMTEKIKNLADREDRTFAGMVRKLLAEALEAREGKGRGNKGGCTAMAAHPPIPIMDPLGLSQGRVVLSAPRRT